MMQKPDNQRRLKQARPKNLNLFTIRMPVNALVSILHRVSGVVLFLILPLVLVLLQLSLHSAQGFAVAQQVLNSVLIKLLLLGLAWAFFHHFFAGIRHLAMDVHWATSLIKARFTSKVVLVLGGLATALLAASWVL
jgi:succinate dehydrogenase / fumarate reductase cytochrome b subunit